MRETAVIIRLVERSPDGKRALGFVQVFDPLTLDWMDRDDKPRWFKIDAESLGHLIIAVYDEFLK